jgi:hypothetical protein
MAGMLGIDDAVEDRLREIGDHGHYDALHRLASMRPDASRVPLVIVVDQFEEIITEVSDSTSRKIFLENLAFAASHPDRLVSVVLTLRIDFAGSIQSPSEFARAVRESRLLVLAMSRDELVKAIEQPARKLGHPWPNVIKLESTEGSIERNRKMRKVIPR